MAKAKRIYRCTAEGSRAWESPGSGLPAHYRRLIDLIRNAKPLASDKQCFDWLDELETLGFVEPIGVGY
jgi:hypothetical protein